MLTFGLILFLNMIIFPVISAFCRSFTPPEIPAGFWSLMTVAIGGYVIGRSTEKSVKGFRQQ